MKTSKPPKPKTVIFLMVPNYWAVQPTLEEAWKTVKLIGGSHIRKGGAHYVAVPG